MSIWTLEPAGNSGAASTLADLGIESPVLTRQSQTTGTFTFTLTAATSVTATTEPWLDDAIYLLRRDGVPHFRGRVRRLSRAADPTAESLAVTLEDAWGDLSETPYTQEWAALTRNGREILRTTRALLCYDQSQQRSSTADALAAIIASATYAGLTNLVADIALPTLIPPAIEATNQSCAEMIRTVLRWHPSATAIIDPGETGDTLVVRDQTTAPTRLISLGQRPLESINIFDRNDLQVPDVHVFYETYATQSRSVDGATDDDPASIKSAVRLAVFRDVYPPDSPISRRSMTLTLPGLPFAGGGGDGAAAPQAPPAPTKAAIKTRVLPATGSADDTAKKWWIDHLGLSNLRTTDGRKLDKSDIRLPFTTTSLVQAHRVQFAYDVDDTDDPQREAPSAINPNSTPLWRPPSVSDLPRELVSGSIAEWMGVRASEVVVDATVAVAKSSIDTLTPQASKVFFAARPRLGKAVGVEVWFLDAAVRVIGTTAKTRVYSQLTTTSSGDPEKDTGDSVEKAEKDVFIPDLARRLWEDRQAIPREGSLTLTEREAGSFVYAGAVLSVIHPDRPEWASMAATVQRESLDLDSGTTSVAFGTAQQLGPQDWVALHQAGRRVQDESSGGGSPSGGQPPAPPVDFREDDNEQSPPASGAIVPGTIVPKSEIIASSGGENPERIPWRIVVEDQSAGSIKIACGTIIKSASNLSEKLVIAQADAIFNPTAGQTIRLKLTGSFDAPVATLEIGSTWADYPAAIETSGEADTAAFVSYFYPLWQFTSTATDTTIPIREGVHAQRLVGPHHFLRNSAAYHQPGNRPFAIPFLAPYHRALDA
jgi:hypothetical protein